MITDLKNLLNADLLKQLVEAINENKEFSFDLNGLSIHSNSTGGNLCLTVKYDSSKNDKKLIEQERENFLKLLQGIDDNLFVEICEEMGSDLINSIQKTINDNQLANIKKAILQFKQEAKKILLNKIKLYDQCLRKLDK